MKTLTKLGLLFILMLLLQACPFAGDVDFPPPEQNYEAVVMLRSEFENSTALLPPRTIVNSGKIYVKDDFLFIGEVHEGFHVFDNANPSAPVNIAFLKVLGVSDISIKNGVLYFNNATDLIAVLPNLNNNTLEITKRIPNAFPQLTAPDDSYYDPKPDEIIINWNLIQ